MITTLTMPPDVQDIAYPGGEFLFAVVGGLPGGESNAPRRGRLDPDDPRIVSNFTDPSLYGARFVESSADELVGACTLQHHRVPRHRRHGRQGEAEARRILLRQNRYKEPRRPRVLGRVRLHHLEKHVEPRNRTRAGCRVCRQRRPARARRCRRLAASTRPRRGALGQRPAARQRLVQRRSAVGRHAERDRRPRRARRPRPRRRARTSSRAAISTRSLWAVPAASSCHSAGRCCAAATTSTRSPKAKASSTSLSQ